MGRRAADTPPWMRSQPRAAAGTCARNVPATPSPAPRPAELLKMGLLEQASKPQLFRPSPSTRARQRRSGAADMRVRVDDLRGLAYVTVAPGWQAGEAEDDDEWTTLGAPPAPDAGAVAAAGDSAARVFAARAGGRHRPPGADRRGQPAAAAGDLPGQHRQRHAGAQAPGRAAGAFARPRRGVGRGRAGAHHHPPHDRPPGQPREPAGPADAAARPGADSTGNAT